MTNSITIAGMAPGAVSTVFANTQVEDDLSAGINAGFGLIGYKGKVWSIRYRGEERKLMRDDGDGPRGSIEVVILKSSASIAKIWYEQGYVEGSSSPPDCFSTNGLTPDPAATKKQHATCAACPKNAWGSATSKVTGKATKACGDSKRLAVVPLGDIANEAFGGPMLLRVPAASLQDLAQFGAQMRAAGYPYFAVGVRVGFEAEEAFPKFTFSAMRPLTDAEAKMVLELRDGPTVTRILAEGGEHATAIAAPAVPSSPFEQPPQAAPVVAAPVAAPAPVVGSGFGPVATSPVASVNVAAPAPPAQPPVAAPVSSGFGPMTTAPAADAPQTPVDVAPPSSFEDDLDAQLDELLPKVG